MAERDDRSDHLPTLEEQDPLVTTPRKRRFLWTTLALIAIAVLVVASILAPGGSDDDAADAPLISEAISVHAAELSGLLPPDALVRARCAEQQGGEYSCVVDASDVAGVASGSGGAGVDTARLIVVLADDESLTKRLAGQELSEAPRSGADVAAAIAADDRATLDLTTTYGCAFGPGLRADGGRDDDSPGGFRCTVTKGLNAGADRPTSRYVEFAEDGTVRRDFVIAGGDAGASASAGPAPAG